MINWKEDKGSVYIYDEVVNTIIAYTVTEIDGVDGLSSGLVEEIIGLGKKNNAKGIRLSYKNRHLVIDLYVTIKYGTKIPDLSWNIQQMVKRSMENYFDIKTTKVNINIQGVQFPN